MEVTMPPRRGTPLPLSQLVEETRGRGSLPDHLLESKIYAKLESNSLIEAEPSEVHFSGFELGNEYVKILKLINVSSEVMNIHIVPTQTRHFQTTYTKKYRLIPGLAYTLKVAFCPDEWRYFYDCVRVHCQGEENLLIPVHAYPVIDDLHIPPRIDLSAVPLGQSVDHAIPLRCRCPVGFEFQAFVLQPHAAFTVRPLAGEIPARGETSLTVTFRPVQYETCQITIQLVVSQFNSRPYLCTVTGSCAPRLALGRERKWHPAEAGGRALPPSKVKRRSSREGDKSKSTVDPKPPVDVRTPAGVAKMLIKDSNKLDAKDAISGGGGRQVKEALFTKSLQRDVKEEQENQLRWQVHVGAEPMTERSRRQTLDQREIALHQHTVRSGGFGQDVPAGRAKLSSTRAVREAGQAPQGSPSFQFYTGFHWALRRRALGLFQQAARKILIRCRADRRLASLKSLKSLASSCEAEKTCGLKISPDGVFPSMFPIFSSKDDPLAGANSAALPAVPVDVTASTRVPFFKLQVPQHYKLVNYQPVYTWEAFASYIPAALARPLRSVAADSSETIAAEATPPSTADPKPEEEKDFPCLSFSAPEALLRPVPANPLRIFNPAPGLQTYKPTPKYLESELEFHLCPLPRYAIPGSSARGMKTQAPPTQKEMQEHQVIPEVMTWKNFSSIPPFSHRAPTREPHLTRPAIDYSIDILPLTAPPPLAALPDDPTPLMDAGSSGVQLSPETIRAQFLSAEALVSIGNPTAGTTARPQRERHPEETRRSRPSRQMRSRAMARLKRLDATGGGGSGGSPSPLNRLK